MALSLWLDNLMAYSLQLAILVAAGTLAAYLLRLRAPKAALAYWQILLLACLLLPALQPWRRPRLMSAAPAPVMAPAVAGPLDAPDSPPARALPYQAIALALAAGVAARLGWVALGLLRLHLFRRSARWISRLPAVVREVQSRVGVRANVFLSHEIDSPVTFGVFEATVILPPAFTEMNPDFQRAVVCHELLHVRRRDWAFIILEEIIRSLFWFHPAVWWALGRIHLSREQVVDCEVVAMTGNKQPYLESLLEIARARGRPRAVPAPLFLRERHLVERVALLLKEVTMSKTRLIASLVAAAAVLFCTGYLGAGWFPLTGAPELSQGAQSGSAPIQEPRRAPIRVGGNVQQSKIIQQVDPVYPQLAKNARVAGTVILQATINEEGYVWDVQILKGHPLLNDAAIAAVRQWRYSPTYLNGEPVPVMATVTVLFSLSGNASYGPIRLAMDEAGNLRESSSGETGEALLARIREVGDPISIQISSLTPRPVAEAALQELLRTAARDIRVSGGAYALHNGGLFYGRGSGVTPPELLLNSDLLSTLAAESGQLPQPPAGAQRQVSLVCLVFVNEVGEIVGVQGTSNPKMPAVEDELLRTRVITPGYIGSTPVPAVAYVTIKVGSR